MARDFRELNIWKKGYELALEIYKLTARYPKEEKFGLIDQTRRSANAVIANIAEAHGRYHFADKNRMLYISRGECSEIRSHLSVALGPSYVNREDFDRLDSEYEGLSKGINSFILNIRKILNSLNQLSWLN